MIYYMRYVVKKRDGLQVQHLMHMQELIILLGIDFILGNLMEKH